LLVEARTLPRFGANVGKSGKAQNEQMIGFRAASTGCIVYPPLTALRVHWGISRTV
jgi:hypothetical protein